MNMNDINVTGPDGQRGAESSTVSADSTPPSRPTELKASDIFANDNTFAELGLRASVLKGIEAMGFTKPTHIQAQLIPPILTGRDVLGQAKTGSGKTASFALPLIHMCSKEGQFQAVVLSPTRELAIQITAEINEIAQFTPIRAVTVFGGQAIHAQAKKLQGSAQIIVATPGRLMDMKERGLVNFDNTRFVVLDEVDRMLDIGFRDDIKKILDMTPPTRQTIVVSATISGEIERLARKYMKDPQKIETAAGSLTVSMVEQHYITVDGWDKERLLVHLLTHEEPALTVVFCKLKRTVDKLARKLEQAKIDVHAIHGDMPQGKRNRVMEHLRSGKLAVLVASDLAARGIDVDDISHVINYDLPEDPEVYVHRIGRTARAGRKGVAWAFVTPGQGKLLSQVEDLINIMIPKIEYPDFKPSPRPDGYRDPDDRHASGGLTLANPSGIKPPAPAGPRQTRLEASINLEVPKAPDATKFPGGIVPTALPPNRMFGKLKGRKR
ncbi:MAG: DEAD/DEAH box helicase [Tepidisphaera sp.]